MRGHRQGSLCRRGNNGLWVARVSLPDGSRRTATSMDKRVAQAELLRLLRETGQGVRRTKRLSVAECLRWWLADAVDTSSLAPKTKAGYRGIVKNHLVPLFGDYPIERLTEGVISDGLTRSATSTRTKTHHRAVLHQAFLWAASHRLVAENPVAHARLPTPRGREAATLTLEQAMTVIEKTRGDWLHPLWTLFLTTGVREAEALGLTWDDIDLAAGRATIRATLHRTRDRDEPWERRPTKSGRTRSVPLGPMALAALAAHKAHLADLRRPDWRYFGLVFLTEAGRPYHGSAILARWYETLERLALPRVRVHELRHTAASLMLSLGFGLEDVKQILGHSTIRITSDTYSHPIDSRLKLVADGLDRALRRVQ
jgi:integrase